MANWILDPTHSEVQFKVKHLVISTVTGSFKNFSATASDTSGEFQDSKVQFEADVNSIETGVEQRDGHLKSDDFFNAEQFPKIRFESSSMVKTAPGEYNLNGNLTIRDITKPITLKVEFGGIMTDFYGNTKAGFEVTGKVNRKEFGLKWDAVTEAGGIVVGDDVKIVANVQFAKEA
jgi:polyisoprenoid-binding protein YceI